MPGTGLNLGMGGAQRRQFTQAAQSGTLNDFLGQHQNIQNRFNQRMTGGGQMQQRAQQMYAPTQMHQVQNAVATQGAQSPAVQQARQAAAPVPATQPAAPTAPTAAPQAPPMTYQQFMDQQFGAGNPAGMRNWYGGNPLETAQAAAQRALDTNLAQVRQRYASGGGLGANSGRAALAEGQALGDFGTNLGDILAQRGEGAYQADATRGLNAMQNANQQNLAANEQLGNYGNVLNAIGASEQQLPMVNAIMQLLNMFGRQSGYGNQTQVSQNTSGPMAY